MSRTLDKTPTICPDALVVNWVDVTVFSINPNLVMADRGQKALLRLLEKPGLDVIPFKLRHSNLMGGGHKVTLNIRRTERFSDPSIRRTA
jgi:hypothetical protein